MNQIALCRLALKAVWPSLILMMSLHLVVLPTISDVSTSLVSDPHEPLVGSW